MCEYFPGEMGDEKWNRGGTGWAPLKYARLLGFPAG